MSGVLDRARSVFRRKPRDQDQEDDGPVVPVVGPNGIVRIPPEHHHQSGQRPHQPEQHPQHQGPHQHQQPQHQRPNHQQPHHQQPHHQQPQHQQPHHQQPQPHHRPPPDPGDGSQRPPITNTPATRSGRLTIALHNDTNSSDVYAYISKVSLASIAKNVAINTSRSRTSDRSW